VLSDGSWWSHQLRPAARARDAQTHAERCSRLAMSAVTAGPLPEAPEDWGRGAELPVIQGLQPEAPFWSVARLPVRSPLAAFCASSGWSRALRGALAARVHVP
jgi:hypothetical protein